MTTETMDTKTETSLEEWPDRPAPEDRTMVLTLTVEPQNWAIVFAAVAALRSGLMQGYMVRDAEYLRGYEGPFEVDELDEIILQAMADAIAGHDEGAESDYEPDIVRGRLIRSTSRQIAEFAQTMPVPRPPRKPIS